MSTVTKFTARFNKTDNLELEKIQKELSTWEKTLSINKVLQTIINERRNLISELNTLKEDNSRLSKEIEQAKAAWQNINESQAFLVKWSKTAY